MPTWQHFLEVSHGILLLRIGLRIYQHQILYCIQSRRCFNRYKTCFDGVLRVKSWDLWTWVGLGTPCAVFKIEALIWVSFSKALKFQTFSSKGCFKSKTSIQEHRNEIHNSYQTCAWIMFSVQCEEIRLDHLALLLAVTMPYTCWFLWHANSIEGFKWRLQFGIWGCVLKGCFERGIFWRPKSRLKGIEDFNLEHCPCEPTYDRGEPAVKVADLFPIT